MFTTTASRPGRGRNWLGEGFAGGTLMLFQQSTAPVGWTKQTTHNDKALRVVSGTASSGGSNTFSSTLGASSITSGSTTVLGSTDATTISTSTMPSHNHALNSGGGIVTFDFSGGGTAQSPGGINWLEGSLTFTGSGGSHTHGLSGTAHTHTVAINVAFVDLIIAKKN